MNTYGTRLGIIKQVLKLSYKDLVARLEHSMSDRSIRNYIENKTQMPGDMISKVPEVFPEINREWWHTGEGTPLKPGKMYTVEELGSVMHEPEAQYGLKDDVVSIPAGELFKALFKDMTEVNRLLQSRLEYYDIFIKNMDKYKL